MAFQNRKEYVIIVSLLLFVVLTSLFNELYPQLHHNIKMAVIMGGTMYRDPMERLMFRYVHREQHRRKLW